MCTNWTRTHVQKLGHWNSTTVFQTMKIAMQCTMVENRLESRTKATLHYIVFPITFQ